MPKKKTNKAAAKRFKKTAGGGIKHARAGTGHLMSSKTRKRKRALRKDHVLSPTARKRIENLISN